jgi:hypothetical protein
MILASTISQSFAQFFLPQAIKISFLLDLSGITKPNLSLSWNSQITNSSSVSKIFTTIASVCHLKSTNSAFTLSPSLAQFFFFQYTKYHFSLHSTSIKPKSPFQPE